MRSTLVGGIALMAAFASAQFDGPAPAAWRWLPPSGIAATGAPLVSGDTIYVASGGRIYAIDKSTGNKLWQFPAEDPIPGSFRTAPILCEGVLVAVSDKKLVFGVDPVTGQKKWDYAMANGAIGSPVDAGKMCIVEQSDNSLIALNPADGTPGWVNPDTKDMLPYKIGDGLYGQIAGHGDSIMYFTNRFELHSVNVASRKEDWNEPVRFTTVSPTAAPVLYGDTVYVASGPYLVAINPALGTPIWQVPTGFSNIPYNPCVSSSGVFIVSDNGDMMLFDLSGQPSSMTPRPVSLGSSPVTSPTAVGTKYVVLTTSGGVDLFDPKTGTVIWDYVVRPIDENMQPKQQTQSGRNGPGGFGGGPGGLGGGPGGLGGGPGGFGGGPGGLGGGPGGQAKPAPPPSEVIASGPAVLDGSTLIVPESDSSLVAFDPNLGVDLTPPKVELLFPNPGDQVSGQPPLLLYFKVRDWGSGVNEKTLKLTIDGKPYDYTYKRDGSIVVTFSSLGHNRPLNDGRHQVLVDVSDWMGNEAKQSFLLTIDNTLPPIVLPGQEEKNQNGKPGGFGPGGAGGKGEGGGGGAG